MKPNKISKSMPLILIVMIIICTCCAPSAPDDLRPTDLKQSPDITPILQSPSGGFFNYDNFPYPYETELKVSSNVQLILSKQQALEDYDALFEILEDSYPFLDIIKAELGIDWKEIREVFRTELIEACVGPSILQVNYIKVISNCLKQFQNIGHLYIIQPFLYRYMADTFRFALDSKDGNTNPKSEENSDAMILSKILSIIDSQQVRSFYKYYEDLESIPTSSTTQSLPQDQSLYEEVRRTIVEDMVGNDIPYINLSSFAWSSPECTPIAIEMIKDFFKKHSDADEIIIDIQGNGGGSTSVWQEGIVSLLIDEPLVFGSLVGIKAGKLNRFMLESIESELNEVDNDRLVKEYPNINPEEFDDLRFYSSEVICSPSDDSIGFEGRLWVLTDGGNYSASDAFASFCSATGFAKLVGHATAGNGSGGQPYAFALPNSGLLIYLDPYFCFNQDGTCNAIAGTKPDIEAKEGQSALEACLAAIEQTKR